MSFSLWALESSFYREGTNNVSVPILALFIDPIEKKVPQIILYYKFTNIYWMTSLLMCQKCKMVLQRLCPYSILIKVLLKAFLLGASILLVNLKQELSSDNLQKWMATISLQTSHSVSAFSSEILIEELINSKWSPWVNVCSAKIQIQIQI